MELIAFLMRAAKWQVLLALFSGVLNGLCSAGLVAFVVNAGLRQEYADADAVVIFIVLAVLIGVSRILSSVLLTRLGQSAIFRLRGELARRILATPYRRLQELGAPALLANLTDDVAVIAESFSWIPVLCVNLATVAGCLAYVAWLSPALFAVIAVVMFFGVFSFRVFEASAVERFKEAREYEDSLFKHFRGLTEGIKELQLNRKKCRFFLVDELDSTAEQGKRCHISAMTIYALGANWGAGLFYVVVGLFLFLLPKYVALTPESVTGAVFAVIYMMAPLTSVFDGSPILGRAQVALRKLKHLNQSIASKAFDPQAEWRDFEPGASNNLELVDVTHRYFRDDTVGDFLLGPINLHLAPSEIVFIVGGNGSGKTTLAMVVTGLYASEGGVIKLDGERITELNRENYRQHFSAVFSDFFLFESLLGFDNPELDQKAREILASLRLDHKVTIDKGRFSTLDLSRGQRKRLALLVAFLEDRPFYVFDEWAADQDPIFKRVFYTEILPALKSRAKSVIVISHDDAYFHVADRCLRLEDGKVTEIFRPSEANRTRLRIPSASKNDFSGARTMEW